MVVQGKFLVSFWMTHPLSLCLPYVSLRAQAKDL